MIDAPKKQLTLDHFIKWLDGQIAFGVGLHTDTRFCDLYLSQHSTQQPDEPLRRILRRLPRETTATRLKEILERSNSDPPR